MTVPAISGMPAPALIIPEQGEEWFPVRMREWARLKGKVDELRRHRRRWENAGWALVGLGGSALLSWLPYVITGSALTVIPVVTLVVGFLSTGVGIVSLVAAEAMQTPLDAAIRDLKRHLFDMESALTADQRQRIADMVTNTSV